VSLQSISDVRAQTSERTTLALVAEMPSLRLDAIGKRCIFASPGQPHSSYAKRERDLISKSHPLEAVWLHGSFGARLHISTRLRSRWIFSSSFIGEARKAAL
jgi:hypothetical protein